MDSISLKMNIPTRGMPRRVKAVLGSGDADAINAKVQALGQVAMKLGEAVYQAEQEKANSGADAAGSEAKPSSDDVVDAEFTDVDENKK